MVSRFLITTAFEKTWPDDPSEPVIFLGEWCKLYSRRHRWSKMDYEVLPYHWDDHKKLTRDYHFLNNLYEKILLELSHCLNQLHGVNHSVRYWRILIGLWLYTYIYVLYDRYQSILSCARYGEVKTTTIYRSNRYQDVPKDFLDFVVAGAACSFWAERRTEGSITRVPNSWRSCRSLVHRAVIPGSVYSVR